MFSHPGDHKYGTGKFRIIWGSPRQRCHTSTSPLAPRSPSDKARRFAPSEFAPFLNSPSRPAKNGWEGGSSYPLKDPSLILESSFTRARQRPVRGKIEDAFVAASVPWTISKRYCEQKLKCWERHKNLFSIVFDSVVHEIPCIVKNRLDFRNSFSNSAWQTKAETHRCDIFPKNRRLERKIKCD